MSVEIPDDLVGLDAANAELERMIAADAATASKDAATTQESAITEGERAAQAEKENTQDQVLSKEKTDALAAAEAASKETAAATAAADKSKDPVALEATKKAEAATALEAGKSRYQKAQERQQNSWAELNAGKDALKAEQNALRLDREEFQRKTAEHQAKVEKAEQEFSPEQYEAAAKDFEAKGKFDLAELAKSKADELRKNPPAQREQKAAALVEGQKKEWALKAGVDFPEVARTNSPLQLRVAQLFKEEPDLKSHPKGIYVAARIASLEAAAASVSTLKSQNGVQEKELGQLRAKVKELEALTAPGGPGSATVLPGEKSFEQKSDSEQFQELTEQAQRQGVLHR